MPVQVSGDRTDRLSGVYTEYWEDKDKIEAVTFNSACFTFSIQPNSTLTQVEISSTTQWNYLNL